MQLIELNNNSGGGLMVLKADVSHRAMTLMFFPLNKMSKWRFGSNQIGGIKV